MHSGNLSQIALSNMWLPVLKHSSPYNNYLIFSCFYHIVVRGITNRKNMSKTGKDMKIIFEYSRMDRVKFAEDSL